jgi:hypothetical protein
MNTRGDPEKAGHGGKKKTRDCTSPSERERGWMQNLKREFQGGICRRSDKKVEGVERDREGTRNGRSRQ